MVLIASVLAFSKLPIVRLGQQDTLADSTITRVCIETINYAFSPNGAAVACAQPSKGIMHFRSTYQKSSKSRNTFADSSQMLI